MAAAVDHPNPSTSRFVLPAILLLAAQAYVLVLGYPASPADAAVVLALLAGATLLLWLASRGTGRAASRALVVIALGGTAWPPLWISLAASLAGDVILFGVDFQLIAGAAAPVVVAACWYLAERSERHTPRHALAVAGLTLSAGFLIAVFVIVPALSSPWGVEIQ